MLPRKVKQGIKLFAGLVLSFGIFAGFVAWRLTSGHPIHLAFLVPVLERSLASADDTIRLEFDDIVIAWIPGEQPLGLQALGLRAFTKDGTEVANVGQVGFRVSIPALLQGKFAPSAINVFHIAIHFHRGADGQFKILRFGSKSAAEDRLPANQLLTTLLAGPKSNRIYGYLRRIGIVGGSVSFEDDITGLTWHAPRIDIELVRASSGIDARASVQIAELGNPAEIDVSASLEAATGQLNLHGSYRGIDIVSLGLIAPELIATSNSQLQFSGDFDTSLNLAGPSPAPNPGAVHFTVAAGPGMLDLPGYLSAPLPIAKLDLAGELASGFDSFTLESLTLDLGGPVLDAKGKISGLVLAQAGGDGRVRIRCDLIARDLPVPDVPRLWPLSGGQSSDARDWFKSRMDQGRIEKATATFDIAMPRGDPDATEILAFNGRLTANGVALRFAPQLPPIRDARVEATVDASKATFDIAGGGAGGLAIQKARAVIADLDKQTQTLEVAGDVAGPLRDALLLLGQAGAVNLETMGIKAADAAGSVSASLRFRFPDIGNISFGDAEPVVSARIVGGRLDGLLAGHDLSDADVDLKLDADGIAANGHARLAGIPAEVQWNEAFGADDLKTRIAIAAQPSADDLAALGLDLRNEIQGPLPMNVVYRRFARQQSDVTIDTDLTPTALALGFVKWRKPPGLPAHADGRIELADGRPISIASFDFHAGDFSGGGRGRFARDGRLAEVVLDQVALGKTQLSNVVVSLGADRLDISVGGGDFDAEPFRDKGESLGIAKRTSAATAGQTPGTAAPYAFSLTAERLDRIFLGEGQEIDSLRLIVADDGRRLQSLEADGVLRGGSPFQLRWQPATNSSHWFSLTAGDAGGALKALNIFDDVVGGRLTITGTSPDDEAGQPLTAHAEISQYRLVGQPFLLRLFTMATLTGLADGLTSDGLLMRRFVADFHKLGGRVDVPSARTYGPSLALTAAGYFDLGTDRVDINGAIVPANALNSLVGQVPLVGFLLTGGNGNGIGSATFTATGKLSEPTIAVQPLSAIEPAFLRSIFDLSPTGATAQ